MKNLVAARVDRALRFPEVGTGRAISIIWLVWALSRLVGVMAVHGRFPYQHVFGSGGDVLLYHAWASSLWHGSIPYRDFWPVYPPGFLPVLALPPPSLAVYRAEFFFAAFSVDALVLRALLRSGRRSGAWLWVAAAPFLGPIFWSRLDIFVAGMVVAGILSFERGRYSRAAVWLTVAGLIKLWPILVVVVLIRLVPVGRRRSFLLGSAATIAVGVVPFLALGGAQGLWNVIHVQTGRGVEYESIFALPLFLVQAAGHYAPIVVSTSVQFGGPSDALVSAIATGLFAAGVCYCLWRARFRPLPHADPARWLLLVVVVVLLTDKVLSAQYLIWTAAAIALFLDRAPNVSRMFTVTCVLLFATQLQFPLGFYQMILGTPDALPFSAMHAAVLVFFAALAFIAIEDRRIGTGVVPVERLLDETASQDLEPLEAMR